MPPAAPTSICLLRLSALGDVCNTIPLVRTLQNAWPETALTWIIGRAEHRLVQSLPRVEFIVFNKKAGFSAWSAVRRQLQGRRFEILLHTQVSTRSNLLSLLVRARRRIGFDQQRAREGHGLVINERIAAQPFQHQALALWSFAEHLGLPTNHAERTLPVTQAGHDFARQHQPENRKAVLISPASSHPTRNWHPKGYAAVADWIIAQTGRPVILVGGPSEIERELGEQIVKNMQQPVVNLIGQDTLDQALAMMQRAACLISPDAGPAHFAAALGTPVIGLYAATWSLRSGPLGSLEYCVDRYPEAARKFTKKPPEALRWGRRLEYPGVMDLIHADDIIAKLRILLKD